MHRRRPYFTPVEEQKADQLFPFGRGKHATIASLSQRRRNRPSCTRRGRSEITLSGL